MGNSKFKFESKILDIDIIGNPQNEIHNVGTDINLRIVQNLLQYNQQTL